MRKTKKDGDQMPLPIYVVIALLLICAMFTLVGQKQVLLDNWNVITVVSMICFFVALPAEIFKSEKNVQKIHHA
jgi:hypothetical protein